MSCGNGNEVGLILLHHGTELIQVLQGYDPTADRQSTPVGRQRDLTENEVTLAENKGLDTIDLADVRIEHSSAFYVDEDGRPRESAWWVDRAHPNTIFVPKLFVSSGGQFVNLHFEEDFTSIDKQAVLIHELTHVHQGMDGNWIHGGRGTETAFHRYGYRDSDGKLEHNDFSLYSEEEQAEIMEDRFRLKSGQSPDFSDCDDSAEPCNAPSSLTIAQMYSQLDMLENIPEDED